MTTSITFSNAFIIISLLFGILDTSEGFKCFVCNSALHVKCGESSPSLDYLVECTDSTAQPSKSIMTQRSDLEPQPESRRNYTFCRKNVDSIPRQDNRVMIREAETRVVRSCGWVEPEKVVDTCKWGAADGVHRLMCTCTSDECNSATNVHLALISFISCSIFLLCSSTFLIKN